MAATDTSLKSRIQNDMKDAMRAKDKERLGVIRMILAAIKQKEVDERTEQDDTAVLATLDKMLKQRRDSLSQYESAGRDDLAKQEQYEITVIQDYMPKQLSDDEIAAIIDEVIAATGAESAKDMGKVMGALKPRLQGRCDMGQVSGKVKARLAG
jgi:uncharacterized protein YqeY